MPDCASRPEYETPCSPPQRSTTTFVPTGRGRRGRSRRSLVMRMQPEETAARSCPARSSRGCGRATSRDRGRGRRAGSRAAAPCGAAGRDGAAASAAGGRQSGHSRFMETVLVPAQVKPGRPTPTPYWIAWPSPEHVVEPPLRGRDHDRARRLPAVPGDDLARDRLLAEDVEEVGKRPARERVRDRESRRGGKKRCDRAEPGENADHASCPRGPRAAGPFRRVVEGECGRNGDGLPLPARPSVLGSVPASLARSVAGPTPTEANHERATGTPSDLAGPRSGGAWRGRPLRVAGAGAGRAPGAVVGRHRGAEAEGAGQRLRLPHAHLRRRVPDRAERDA